MRLNAIRRWTAAAVLSGVVAGCAPRDRLVDDEPSPTTAPSVADRMIPIPLAIQGQNTIIHLSFPNRDSRIEPGDFHQDEICYLTAGDFRIDCYTDGSTLTLGPNDENDLLTDNPMSGLSPLHASDKDAATAMRLYGILFLVGGSVDRLPATLSDYLGSPGQHLNEAIALTDALLNQKNVQFAGHARGGDFVITVELTDDGRDKLEDAMDEIGEPTGPNQTVVYRRAHAVLRTR